MPPITDQLALDRTRLANERTLLAYLRTALGFAAAGVTLWRVYGESLPDRILGAALIAVGAVLLLAGGWRSAKEHLRYRQMARELS